MMPSYSSPRRGKRTASTGKNDGKCAICGEKVNWRSISGRCWTCEMDDAKNKKPVGKPKDIVLPSTSNNG